MAVRRQASFRAARDKSGEPLPLANLCVRPMRFEEIEPVAAAVEDMSAAQFRNRWHEREMGYRELLVAELDGELVGTVSIKETGSPTDAMHLFALEVGPAWRRRGIGTDIVRFVLEEARQRGLRSVYLEVRVDNPARRIYHRLGFRRVGDAFLNAWWLFDADGSQKRIEEMSYRMVKRISRR